MPQGARSEAAQNAIDAKAGAVGCGLPAARYRAAGGAAASGVEMATIWSERQDGQIPWLTAPDWTPAPRRAGSFVWHQAHTTISMRKWRQSEARGGKSRDFCRLAAGTSQERDVPESRLLERARDAPSGHGSRRPADSSNAVVRWRAQLPLRGAVLLPQALRNLPAAFLAPSDGASRLRDTSVRRPDRALSLNSLKSWNFSSLTRPGTGLDREGLRMPAARGPWSSTLSCSSMTR